MMEWGKKWPAPAKLNLMLRITGQRDDGYHLLQTVFQFIELCDWITYRPVKDGKITLLSPISGVPEEDDLTIRAANILRRETGCQEGVSIEVEKNLPMGGGLGGGSSDAATTLVVLNKLWKLNISKKRLMQLGLELGADVPIFVYGKASWAEGVGEKIEEIDLPEKWIVVIKPECHVDTKEIFSTRDLTRNSKSIRMADFLAGQHQNDCLDVVSKLYQPVENALEDLARFSNARLTGTGACVFAEFDSEELAREAWSALNTKWQIYLTRGLNKSPLFDVLLD
jgi:4-diphosphocytidyl-2-C-methyl-D-erythritol kinase